ncbi:hypothetical protein D3C81_1679490 [compost metagenome]
MFFHGNIIRRCWSYRMGCNFRLSGIRRFFAHIDDFSIFHISKPNGTVIRPLPTIISYNMFFCSVRVLHLKLCQQLCLLTIYASYTHRSNAPPIPAVSQFCCNYIFAYFQKGGYIISLIVYPFVIISKAGSHNKISDTFTVNFHFIQSACRNI